MTTFSGSPEAGSTPNRAKGSYGFTLLVIFGLTIFFFRAILPRIPRLFLGGRLRVKRVGFRGIRGIEWRSKGFKKKTSAAFDRRDDQNHQDEGEEDDNNDDDDTLGGTIVKIKQIYLHLHSKNQDTQSTASLNPKEAASDDTNSKERSTIASKTWITLRIEGVGITLSRVDEKNEEVQKRKKQQEQDAIEKEQERGRQDREAEEERLNYLLQSRPSSPMLNSSRSNSRSVSPMPTFATAMSQDQAQAQAPSSPTILQPSKADDVEQEKESSIVSQSVELTIKSIHFIREVILPLIRLSILNTLRTTLYLLISTLPFLTSVIDIQITHVEVYSLDAEVVIRVESVGLDLDMSLIPSLEQADKAKEVCSFERASRHWIETITSMPNKIGSGAKGAASFITDGLPAGRVSLRLFTRGLQVFEATMARRLYSPKSVSNGAAPHQPFNTLADQAWSSFSANSASTASGMNRSRSIASFSSLVAGDGGPKEWAEWAIKRPDSQFTTQTSWLKGSESKQGQVIHPSARVLSMPDSNILQVGLILGGSSSISTKESLHIGIDLCKTAIGADALAKVLILLESRKAVCSRLAPSPEGAKGTRSQLSKHIKQQRPGAQAKFLEKLGSASFSWPNITLIMSSKVPISSLASLNEPKEKEVRMPSSVQMLAQVQGIAFSLKTSNAAEELHQRWLGTCGIKGHGRLKNTRTFSNRFRWASNRQKVEHVEHRRAFNIEAGVKSVEVRVGIEGEGKDTQSELLNLGHFKMRARSTWTPFGLLSTAKESNESAKRLFLGDPNEQAVVLEIGLGRLVGDLQIKHATALLAFAKLRSAQRKSRRKELGLVERVPERPSEYLDSLPRFSMGVQLDNLSYRLDASEIVSSESLEQRLNRTDLSLVVAIPKVNFALHANYEDQYIKRSEQEKKAAWKSLSKDELEWSLKEDGGSKSNQAYEDGKSLPRQSSGEYKKWQEDKHTDDDMEEDEPDENEIKRRNSQPAEKLTMAEALKRMKELMVLETMQGQTQKGKVSKYANKWKKAAHKKATLFEKCPVNTRYVFESHCTVDLVEAFYAMNGDATSTRRKNFDSNGVTTADARLGHGLNKHHILGLNCFELSNIGHLPGYQDVISDAVRLDLSNGRQDVRLNLENVDFDMWSPCALEATRKIVQVFYSRKVPSVPDDSEQDQHNDKQQSDTEQPQKQVIDAIHAGTSAYISIGSIIAHVGGVDERCDHTMSRGLGFEGKRAVIELACFKSGTKRQVDDSKWSLGARSALDLPEDLRSGCRALASRHGKAAMAKLSLFEFGLFPLLDAEQAAAQHLNRTLSTGKDSLKENSQEGNSAPISPSIFAPAIWDFQNTRPERSSRKQTHAKYRQQDRSNFIFWMPFSATKVSLVPKITVQDKIGGHEEQLLISTEGTRLLSFKIELLHTYCILMAMASIKSLLPKKETQSEQVAEGKSKEVAKKPSKFAPLTHRADFKIDEIHVSIALPNEVNIFCHIRRFEFLHKSQSGIQAGFDGLMAAVKSAKFETNGIYEQAVRIRDLRVKIEKREKDTPMKIVVNGDGLLIRVPFDYKVHPLIDGTIVSIKSTRQLIHQFVKGKNDSIITPCAEKPKHLPIIKIRLRALAFAGADDPFETRLNIIWRAGGDENQARAERDAAFKERARQMESSGVLLQSATASTLESSIDTHSTFTDEETTNSSNDKKVNEGKVLLEQARQALDAFNASSWIRRYANASAEQGRREEAALRAVYGRIELNCRLDLPIKLAPAPRSSPLFRSVWADFEIEVGPTTFPESELRNFLYEQGQGMPKDMEYSLMVPMHLKVTCAEWKITLRDYPLPLFHVPPINPDKQPRNLYSFELEADICIAEQLSDSTAIRHIPAIIVPASTGRPDAIEYGISVPRMAMPTKLFGSPIIKMNSSYPTRLVWGQSVQPAIHDIVRVIEGITSPPHDPSPRIGFWDKMSLILHGRVHFQFPGDGELHIYLKGSRDPYHILEHGSGWVKCWRGNVEMKLNFENEQHEIFQIISHEYLLAIPDLRAYIDRAATGTDDRYDSKKHHQRRSSDHNSLYSNSSQESSNRGYKQRPDFKKVCMKLTNGVRWGAGLLLERTCTDESCPLEPKCKGPPFNRECRIWTRKKHWEVYQRSQDYAKTISEDQFGDSFEGWRSHHLHFSLSIYSPKTGLKRAGDDSSRGGDHTNNLYFSPLSWEHFWAWFRLFNSALSLPIREGKLFPGSQQHSPKFGRHLATIKYRFDLSPLFITHVYPQDSKSDWARGVTTHLGIKSRMGTFHFDLHQRQQEMLKYRPELNESRKVFHKPFYEAEIDLADIDLRTLAAQFQEPEKQLFPNEEFDGEDYDDIFGNDQDCKIQDRDLDWHDLSDFVELDWAPSVDGKQPKIRLIQAMSCPRFNYYRRIESQRERKARAQKEAKEAKGDSTSDGNDDSQQEKQDEFEEGEEDELSLSKLEKSKFGREKTHVCLVGKAPATQDVQKELALERIRVLTEDLHKATASSNSNGSLDSTGKEEETTEPAKVKDLKRKIKMIEEYIKMLDRILGTNVEFSHAVKDQEKRLQDDVGRAAYSYFKGGASGMKNLQAIYREWEAFDNRYFVHNPSIFYSNATRDVLLKYYISSRKRRGIVHSLSARAVRYIRDLGKPEDDDFENQNTTKRKNNRSKDTDNTSQHTVEDGPELLRGLLRETMQYIIFDEIEDSTPAHHDSFDEEEVDPSYGISHEYEVRKSNVCVLLKPQIVLRSLANDKSTVILTAIRTRIHNYSVKDPRVEEDSVNERVMYRNYFSIDGLQGFHPSKHCSYLERAKQRYGFLHVPLETLIDLKYETKDFERIAPRTDAHAHYDKFNRLRLHDSNRPLAADVDSQDPAIDHLRHRMDLIRLRCPRFAVLANSEHFGAIYNIVTDLLLYRDPAYREHAKKLEMMMFSHDFSDLDTLASVVQALQVRIRHAKELYVQYQLHFSHLNEQGRMDFLTLKGELQDLIEELILILEAIKISDDQSGSDKDKKSALRVEAQANDIAWNMMGHEEGELLAKLTIKGASFTWLNKADNSAANTLSIMDLNAVNVKPDAVFTEIITKYNKIENHPMRQKGMLLNAMWSVLAPVGGISIIDYLEIALHPLQIQLEKKIGRHLEDYLFGSKREREKKDREQREMEEAMQEHINKKTSKGSALKRLTRAIKGKEGKKDHNHHQQQQQHKNGGGDSNDNQMLSNRRSQQTLRKPSKNLSRKSSTSEMRTLRTSTGLHNGNNEDDHSGESDSDETGQHAIAAKQALEMRNRASRNTAFVNAKVYETIFCLSYKGEKQKSITDLYDLVFRAPRLEYRNRIWAHADLANHLKKDILKAAWNQKATLLRGVIHHRRPRHQAVADNIRAIRDAQLTRLSGSSSSMATFLPPSETNKLKELEEDLQVGINNKETFEENGNDKARDSNVPAFRMNVDPPDQSYNNSQEVVTSFPEEFNGQHFDEMRLQSKSEESGQDNQSSGPVKLGKLFVKTLGGGGGKKSRSSSQITTTRSRKSSLITGEHDYQISSSDSDSQDEESNDDDTNEEDQIIHREDDHHYQNNQLSQSSVDPPSPLDSPHSNRSKRSALTSRFGGGAGGSNSSSTPAAGVINHHQQQHDSSRRSSGQFHSHLLSNVHMPKIHAPWNHHRKDSSEDSPASTATTATTANAANAASLVMPPSPHLNQNTQEEKSRS